MASGINLSRNSILGDLALGAVAGMAASAAMALLIQFSAKAGMEPQAKDEAGKPRIGSPEAASKSVDILAERGTGSEVPQRYEQAATGAFQFVLSRAWRGLCPRCTAPSRDHHRPWIAVRGPCLCRARRGARSGDRPYRQAAGQSGRGACRRARPASGLRHCPRNNAPQAGAPLIRAFRAPGRDRGNGRSARRRRVRRQAHRHSRSSA